MKLPESKVDITRMVAEETGFSRKIVQLVIRNFESTLRYYLSNPTEVGKAILLKGFGKFTFDIETARRNRAYNKIKKEKYLSKWDERVEN